jgi:hypothetical protein
MSVHLVHMYLVSCAYLVISHNYKLSCCALLSNSLGLACIFGQITSFHAVMLCIFTSFHAVMLCICTFISPKSCAYVPVAGHNAVLIITNYKLSCCNAVLFNLVSCAYLVLFGQIAPVSTCFPSFHAVIQVH